MLVIATLPQFQSPVLEPQMTQLPQGQEVQAITNIQGKSLNMQL